MTGYSQGNMAERGAESYTSWPGNSRGFGGHLERTWLKVYMKQENGEVRGTEKG